MERENKTETERIRNRSNLLMPTPNLQCTKVKRQDEEDGRNGKEKERGKKKVGVEGGRWTKFAISCVGWTKFRY